MAEREGIRTLRVGFTHRGQQSCPLPFTNGDLSTLLVLCSNASTNPQEIQTRQCSYRVGQAQIPGALLTILSLFNSRAQPQRSWVQSSNSRVF
jgi:hypothetical protein